MAVWEADESKFVRRWEIFWFLMWAAGWVAYGSLMRWIYVSEGSIHWSHHVSNNASWLIQRPSLVNFWRSLIFFSSPAPYPISHARIHLPWLPIGRDAKRRVARWSFITHVVDFLHKRIIAFQRLMQPFQPITASRDSWRSFAQTSQRAIIC